MGIYRLNGNFAVRLKALQLYIYWDALSGRKFRLSLLRRALPYAIELSPFRALRKIIIFPFQSL
ncbi:hypothetical protein DW691_11650 [Bacteroides xylanisolvens]|uniref:Uncharacterized protein n=1 Tax=Bacteroides xylanisolvens TaxID=371601 RepID=A0A415KJV3_9BACE|nr:hypothetical protein DW691_11650 [Bacteroides xylanisolvens]RHL36553.1 hypothetical protein DW027_14110 [Bacteroides xylanisolvens]